MTWVNRSIMTSVSCSAASCAPSHFSSSATGWVCSVGGQCQVPAFVVAGAAAQGDPGDEQAQLRGVLVGGASWE
jgi:hypothetical protein